MKLATAVLCVLVATAAAPASARDLGRVGILSCGVSPARWAPRHGTVDTRFAITTEGGEVTLLMTPSVVALQLSDRKMHEVDRELRGETRDDQGTFAAAIESAVCSAVRSLLDHSLQLRIGDIRDVDYQDGELVFTTEHGRHPFHHIDVSDDDVMSQFSPHDAEAFVREFRRVKAHMD